MTADAASDRSDILRPWRVIDRALSIASRPMAGARSVAFPRRAVGTIVASEVASARLMLPMFPSSRVPAEDEVHGVLPSPSFVAAWSLAVGLGCALVLWWIDPTPIGLRHVMVIVLLMESVTLVLVAEYRHRVIRFLSERRRTVLGLHRQLKHARIQTLQTAHLACLGTLVADVVDDINAPITTILGNSEPVRRELTALRAMAAIHGDTVLPRAAERLAAMFEVMVRGADRIAGIMRDLGTLADTENGRSAPIDVNERILVSLRLLQPRLADRIAVHTDLGPVPLIEGSASQLNQIFINLLANACESIHGQGHIWISSRTEGGAVKVSVHDDGLSIAPETLKRALDSLVATSHGSNVTRLALAVSADAVRALGGALSASSEPGDGSIFTVVIPLRGVPDSTPWIQ